MRKKVKILASIIDPIKRQYRTSKINVVFFTNIKGWRAKRKNPSTNLVNGSCLVAGSIELSNLNQFKNDFLKIAEFANQSSSSTLLV